MTRKRVLRILLLAVALGLWFLPPPSGLTSQTWHLFAIFAATTLAVIVGVFRILTASVFAAAAVVLTGTLSAADAYSGFANPTIVLIIIAFLVARAVVKCGLGQRFGYRAISIFGRSALGLSYSVFIVDALIAPAFPSNTARSGVLFPLTLSMMEAAGVTPDREDRKRLGAFLMFSGIASLALSSALWITAMAANPIGADVAKEHGVEISFATWLVASSIPTLLAIALTPLFLHRLIRPEVTRMPDAPVAARKALAEMGAITRDQKIVAATFVLMVLLWALAGTLRIDVTAVAFLGFGILLGTNVLTLDDIANEGDALATFIWFAVLFALSSQLSELGFMEFLGNRMALRLSGLSTIAAGISLLLVYVLLHYLFVSQTAHLLALFSVFLSVGVQLGVSAPILAFQLLFATNYFSALTPQASSANLLFVSSGYLAQPQLYRLGIIFTAFCIVLYSVVGTAWLWLVIR